MLDVISRRLRFGPLSRLYDHWALVKWEKRGRPIPPPSTFKRRLLIDFARRFECAILVETGTYRGDTLWVLRNDFVCLYSIELDPQLYAAAVNRFAGISNVTLISGDSGEKLGEVLDNLHERAIFWLDGHYCGPGTGIGAEMAPVMKEMEAIFADDIKDHIVLLDDARDFIGRAGYPTVKALRAWVQSRRPGWVVEVADDVIRVYPEPDKAG